MELENIKLPQGNTLISVAIPISWVNEKKISHLPWRRIVREGLNSISDENKQTREIQTKIRDRLELEIQNLNKRISEYEQLLSVRR